MKRKLGPFIFLGLSILTIINYAEAQQAGVKRWRPTSKGFNLNLNLNDQSFRGFQIVHLFDSRNPFDGSFVKNNTKVLNTELEMITPALMKEAEKRNVKVVAYFSASYEYEIPRPDIKNYPNSAMGKKMGGWNEKWGDIRDTALQVYLENRMKRAKALGVHGIEIDNTDIAWNDVGFKSKVTKDQNVLALKQLADRAHNLGLAIFLKNSGDAVEYDNSLANYYDGVFNEQCNQYGECDQFNPFVIKQKPIFIIEYASGTCKPFPGALVQYKSQDYFESKFRYCK